jgi:protein tyrosine/serine phosphatase
MSKVLRGLLASGLALAVLGTPLLYHRYRLTTDKRLRAVGPGRFYRSGQLTATGFTDAIRHHHFRTIINVQNEFPDPDLRRSFLDWHTIKETELCRQLGVRYVFLDADLVSRRDVPEGKKHPRVIEEFLAIMDDPDSYPVLIHCKAGLHRTGCLVAVYRMEYQGWRPAAAVKEMKDLGFGDWACTSANDYIEQYVLTYQRRPRENERLIRGTLP